jgi:hypothetical protein
VEDIIDKRIINHYWQLSLQHESIVALYQDRLKHEFYLNGKDFQQFPSLRGAVCLILWEENGEVKFELET